MSGRWMSTPPNRGMSSQSFLLNSSSWNYWTEFCNTAWGSSCVSEVHVAPVISTSRTLTFLASSSTHLFPSAPAGTRAARAPEATAGPHGQAQVPHLSRTADFSPNRAAWCFPSAEISTLTGTLRDWISSIPHTKGKKPHLKNERLGCNVYRFSSSRRNCWVGSIFCFA